MTLDEAWAAAKEAAGPSAKLYLLERDTTVEVYARENSVSLGYGYGKTVVEALTALTELLRRKQTPP